MRVETKTCQRELQLIPYLCHPHSEQRRLSGPQTRHMLGKCHPPEGSDAGDTWLQPPLKYSAEHAALNASESVSQTLYSGLIFWQWFRPCFPKYFNCDESVTFSGSESVVFVMVMTSQQLFINICKWWYQYLHLVMENAFSHNAVTAEKTYQHTAAGKMNRE